MSNVTFSSARYDFARQQARSSVLVICVAAIFAFIIGFSMPVASPKEAVILDNPETFAGRLVVIGE